MKDHRATICPVILFYKYYLSFMDEQLNLPPLTPASLTNYKNWWTTLSDPWKLAFNAVYSQNYTLDLPADETLNLICNVPVMRFAGPRAMYPNLQIELDDMSGVADLTSLKILVVINHNISNLKGLEKLEHLESLFVFENKLTDISQVAALKNLKEMYFQVNEVTSLQPLKNLLKLKTLYCANNKIASLEGITEAHADVLENFICLPNVNLKDRDIIQFENKVGIRCKKG